MMAGYSSTIIVEGDWQPEHEESVTNNLQIYFKSNKSQGGDCIAQHHHQNTATVLFKSADTRDDVLSKAEHITTVENYEVRLRVRKLTDVASEHPESSSRRQMTQQACGYQEPDNKRDSEEESEIDNDIVETFSTFNILNKAVYKSMRRKLKLPKPITVRVHPAIREFLLKKGLVSSISDKMSSQFCQINMDKPEVLLSPDPALLKQKGVTKKLDINGWTKNTSDAFKNIISNYKAFECQVLYSLWTKAESDIKEVVKDLVYLEMDASKGVLTLAGLAHDTIGLKPILEKILERALTQMERERNSVTEDVEMTPAMYFLLLQDGLQSATAAVSPELHVNYSKEMRKLHLSGLQTEILTFKNWVLEKKLSIKQKSLNIDRSLLEFLRSVDCDEMSRDLFMSHGVSAVYTVEHGDVILIGTSEKALAEAEKRLNTDLMFNTLTVEDQSVLAMPQWHDLTSKLLNEYNTPQKKVVINFSTQRDKVIVSGFSQQVIIVSENLGDLIEKHTRIEEVIHVESHAVVEFIRDRKSQDWQHFMKSDEVTVCFDSERLCIKLSGERMSVQRAMTFFQKMADALHTDTLIIKKAGAKKYFKEEGGRYMLSMLSKETGFVVVFQEDQILEEENENSQELLGKISKMQVGPVTLEVSSGDITKEKTDAIVNSSNQTFTLKAGVSKAILDAAGLQVEQELKQIATESNYKLTEVVTPVRSGKLSCKEIIHIVGRTNPDEIKDAVFSVLELCETHGFTSVAFPALGTGQGGANPADVADAMIDAVIDFVKKRKPAHVKSVKFLLFQTSIAADFHQSLLRRASEKVEKKGMLRRIKEKISTTKEELVMVVEEIEPVVFQLCGETPEDLNKARDMINFLIKQENITITISDPAIGHFTKEDEEMLSAKETELNVSVKLEKRDQDPVITLKGLTGFIHTAESHIKDMIRKVERRENRKREATLTSRIVEWQYAQRKNNFKTFDILTNYDLEEAFNLQKPSVTIKIDGTEFDVDLVRKVSTKGKKQIELKRIDLKAESSLPSHWEDMKGQSVVLVPLSAGSGEYKDVEKEFRRTGMTSYIIKIERVQNSSLWKNYMIKKEELETKNKHKNNEKLLFHGTSPDKIFQINKNGFNRSYAGLNGALYGNGTYFAVDPSYSAKGYSPSDNNGHKRMYLARVLVGDFTNGKKGLLAPPQKSPNGVDLYDSVTDDKKNPSMFVIFHDVQAYPEYLITF